MRTNPLARDYFKRLDLDLAAFEAQIEATRRITHRPEEARETIERVRTAIEAYPNAPARLHFHAALDARIRAIEYAIGDLELRRLANGAH